MSRAMSLSWLLLVVLLLGGCSLVLPVRSYPPLGVVTRIEVKDRRNGNPVRVIDDPAAVKRVVEFVDGQERGWGGQADWAGVPIPQVSAYFYNGSEFLGHFGVGSGFFECQRVGDFSSKSCSTAHERLFLELIGLPGYELRK